MAIREEYVDDILDEVLQAMADGFEISSEQAETRWETYKKGRNTLDVNVDVVYVPAAIANNEPERLRKISNVEKLVAQVLQPYVKRFGWKNVSVTPMPNDGRFTMVTFKDGEVDQVIGDNKDILSPVEPQAT